MKECFLCGRQGYTEYHHIFFGTSNRKWSEKYKLKVDLCGTTCHREGKNSVHKNRKIDLKLKKYGQKKYMKEQNATIDDFRKIFGKNYLDEDEVV